MSECKSWMYLESVSEFYGRERGNKSERESAGGGGRGAGALLALVVLTFATNGLLMVEGTQIAANHSVKFDDDEESDHAPFAVVVQHDPDGEESSTWFCGASLVTLRTALSSRWCARGRELWLLAAATLPLPRSRKRMEGVRRVERVVVANELGGLLPNEMDESSEMIADDAWSGASLDIAILEVETPFGALANVRPILMATAKSDCEVPNSCHVTGVRTRATRPLLRIVDLEIARGDTCADVARHWAAVRDHVICLMGTELCPSDRGAGVVCGGRLCGVVSRSARAADGGAGCGDVHAAQAVARWQRFVQCAHTPRSCSRDGECRDSCMERELLLESSAEAEAKDSPLPPKIESPRPVPTPEPVDDSLWTTATSTTTSVRRTNPVTEPPSTDSTTTSPFTKRSTKTQSFESRRRENEAARARKPSDVMFPTRSFPPAGAAPLTAPSTAAHTPRPHGARVPALPPRMEFDPSRADFKAGAYGDNAADYAGLADEPAASSTTTTVRSSSVPPPPPPPPTRSTPRQSSRAAPPTAEQRAAPVELTLPPANAPSAFKKSPTAAQSEQQSSSATFERPAFKFILCIVMYVLSMII